MHKVKHVLIFDIDDQNTKYVSVSKGNPDVCLNLCPQQLLSIHLI